MAICEGCGYVFANAREVFGAPGQAFCFDCFCEEQQLAEEWWPLEIEKAELLEEITGCERGIQEAQELGNRGDEVRAELRMEAAQERLSDVEEEMECLTVAYQRRFVVIGRAA